MTQAELRSFAQPWRQLPKITAGYALAGFIGAILLTVTQIAFPGLKDSPTHLSVPASKSVPSDYEILHQASPALISEAWDIVNKWNSVQGYMLFLSRYPNSPQAAEAEGRLATLLGKHSVNNSAVRPPQGSEPRNDVDMQIADSGNGLALVAELLQSASTNPQKVNAFLERTGLRDKYKIGLGIFYSNADQTLGFDSKIGGDGNFDLSNLKIKAENDNFCIVSLTVRREGRPLITLQDVCFGGIHGTLHFAQIGNVQIDIIRIAESESAVAWAIGLREASSPP